MGVGQRLSDGMGKLRDRQRRRSEARFAERFSSQFAQHWAQVRAERRQESEPRIVAGPSNFSRAQVPWGVDLAAAWSWRLLVIVAAGYVVVWALARFSMITVPLVIALLLTALVAPFVDAADRAGVNRAVASILTVLAGLGSLALLLTIVGQQVARGFSELSAQVVSGLGEIRDWLREGPLQASDSQISDFIEQTQRLVISSNEQAVARLTDVGTAIGHLVAGFFIVLFAWYFFLADGARIWAWVVRLFPRAARARADSSGRMAWRTLTQFVRATVLVAMVDAVGIMLVALVLKVPFAFAIGVLVFLGSFIPLLGALLSGAVAVLVALVDQGPVVALLMLAGVVLVQQLEAHVLQPFLLGRFVSVHPLGVILAITAGALIGGIVGALIAVPLAAALNAVANHLAAHSQVGDQALVATQPLLDVQPVVEPPPPADPAR